MKKTIIFILVSFLSASAFAQVVDFTDIVVETEQKVLSPKEPVGRFFGNFAAGYGSFGVGLAGHIGWFKTHGVYMGISGVPRPTFFYSGRFATTFGYVYSPARSRKTGSLKSNWFQMFVGVGPGFVNEPMSSGGGKRTRGGLEMEVGFMSTLNVGLNFICGIQAFLNTKSPSISNCYVGVGWAFGKGKN